MTLDLDLQNSYNSVGKKVFNINSLSQNLIQESIDLFTIESLKNKTPRPIDVDVYTLVSGLPFSRVLIDTLLNIENDIMKELQRTLCYWVKPENLAVEYCVFKWPKDNWKNSWLEEITNFLDKKHYKAFDFKISGIQLHEDGCIIAKGFDDGFIRNIRSDIMNNLKFLPNKQSNWAHIPLGRILEPVPENVFFKVKQIIRSLSNINICEENVIDAKLIHETRWYMEKRETLYTKKFKI
tara:strand:+ start:448 stop:1161 length:714 start_codon:yes stop_codon:yes gene_type:complete